MQIEIVGHETIAFGKFKPTEHPAIFLNAESGELIVLQADDRAYLVAID